MISPGDPGTGHSLTDEAKVWPKELRLLRAFLRNHLSTAAPFLTVLQPCALHAGPGNQV